jgi:hypothetical protein
MHEKVSNGRSNLKRNSDNLQQDGREKVKNARDSGKKLLPVYIFHQLRISRLSRISFLRSQQDLSLSLV